jgi:hypothetical protein
MWDSIRNKKQALSLLPLSDKFFTFDETDIDIDNKIEFLPLFYIEDYEKISKNKNTNYDLSFVGTIHSDRYKILKKIEEFALENNLSTYFYFYSPSRLLFWIKKITDKHFFLIQEKDIFYKGLRKEDILNLVYKSKVIIDIEHPLQNGLTMRTIEMLGAQRQLITTNKNIKNYDFYDPSNILIIDRDNIKINQEFFYTTFKNTSNAIYRKYSLTSWIQQIFEL